MKIALISPYVPKHFGGGEKYFFDVATTLATRHEVRVVVADLTEAEKAIPTYEKFLGYSLSSLKWEQFALFSESIIKKLLWSKQFDVIYYLTDGSLFFSLAPKNILHIQVPLQLSKRSIVERLKLANWQIKNTNSAFTKKIVEAAWPTKIDVVHHPFINTEELKLSKNEMAKKEKVILHVGRFFKHLHSKRQDVMIDLFSKLDPKVIKDWQLVFVGGVEDDEYFTQLKKQARGLPIVFKTEISRTELVNWYKKSSIYWHATGFEVDQWKEPTKVEHFGITTVEAMAAGCVPIVINKGGQTEILGQALEKLLWTTPEEAISITERVINDTGMRKSYASLAVKQSRRFDKTRFTQLLWEMVEGKS